MDIQSWSIECEGEWFPSVFETLALSVIHREYYDRANYHRGIQRDSELRQQLAEGKIMGLRVDLRSDEIEIEYQLVPDGAQP